MHDGANCSSIIITTLIADGMLSQFSLIFSLLLFVFGFYIPHFRGVGDYVDNTTGVIACRNYLCNASLLRTIICRRIVQDCLLLL